MTKLVPFDDAVRMEARNSYRGIESLLYTASDKWVGRRKVGRNTYLERRPNGIALLLHKTDVLLWEPCNTIKLNTGGWLTMTTRDRLNLWLPQHNGRSAQVISNNGVWEVRFARLGDQKELFSLPGVAGVAYHDGMVIDLATLTEFTPRYDASRDKSWNDQIDWFLDRWIRHMPEWAGFEVDETSSPGPTFEQENDPEAMRPLIFALMGVEYTKWSIKYSGRVDVGTDLHYPPWVLRYASKRLKRRLFAGRTMKIELRKMVRGLLYKGYSTAKFREAA